MLWNEAAVRDNLRNRDGKRVFYLKKGDQLTSGARDYLSRERIEVLSADQARQEVYRLSGGGILTEKPEHMTHLNGNLLVPKIHPRIRFRGKLDTLEAELLLCQLAQADLVTPVGELLALTRKLLQCEVLEKPVPEGLLWGLSEEDLRRHSHFPQEYYGQPHFMPSVTDGMTILQLNRARCAAREAELAAVEAFTDREGSPTRPDILKTTNRISSALYLLMIREKAKKRQ